VLALSPEVSVTEATPSDLNCCGLITRLKARPETESGLLPWKILADEIADETKGLRENEPQANEMPLDSDTATIQ
jgi:hypothetical protein